MSHAVPRAPNLRDENEIVLRDGSTTHVRSTSPDDANLLRDLLERLSPDALWLRFLGAGVRFGRAAERLTADGVALLALSGTPRRAVAHACFMTNGPGCAEVAFEVDDAWQGRGIGTVLLAHLAQLAEARGVDTFTAVVHPSNHRMLHVFRTPASRSTCAPSRASCTSSSPLSSVARPGHASRSATTSRPQPRSLTCWHRRRSPSSAPRAGAAASAARS
jgi:GNAT superfamily N-acetyltransferase